MKNRWGLNKSHVRLAAIVCFVLWGFGFVVTKYVLLSMPFYVMGAVRYGIAAPTVGRKALMSLPYIRGETARLLFIRTILNVTQMASLFLALVFIDASFVAMFGLLLPLLIYNLAVKYLHESSDRHLLIGSFIAVAGSLLATIAVTGLTGSLNVIGLGLIAINLLSDAISTIYTKKLRETLTGNQLTGMFFLANFFFYAAFTLVMWGHFNISDIALGAWLGVLWLVLFNSVIAFNLYMYSIQRLKASEFSIYFYLSPLVGMIASILLLGESTNALFWAGVGIVIIGILYAERWMKIRVPEMLLHQLHHH